MLTSVSKKRLHICYCISKCFLKQTLFTIAQLLTLVSFVSVFSRERKSERIERKFKTQNLIPSRNSQIVEFVEESEEEELDRDNIATSQF